MAIETVNRLIRELEYYNQAGGVCILLPGMIDGKNGARIKEIKTCRINADEPGIILIAEFENESVTNP